MQHGVTISHKTTSAVHLYFQNVSRANQLDADTSFDVKRYSRVLALHSVPTTSHKQALLYTCTFRRLFKGLSNLKPFVLSTSKDIQGYWHCTEYPRMNIKSNGAATRAVNAFSTVTAAAHSC